MWGCFVHNIVNKRLKKAEFNCENIGDAYDCGCGDEKPKDKPVTVEEDRSSFTLSNGIVSSTARV